MANLFEIKIWFVQLPFRSMGGWRMVDMRENARWKLPQLRRHWLSKDTDIALIPASVFRCAANAFKAADTPSLFCPFKRNAKA
jgi:hypothetical protein